jgi:hypothetical protein
LEFAVLEVTLEQKVSDGLSVTDVRELQKRLKAIDPMLRTQLLRDVKQIVRPLETKIKSSLSGFAPLSGMNTQGRLGMNQGVAFNATTIRVSAKRSSSNGVTSLVSVRTKSPLASLVDMAGKSGRYLNKGSKQSAGRSRSYQRNGATLRNKLNGQGAAMIRALGRQPSRYVWPAVGSAIPAIERAINAVLVNAYKTVNRSF